MIYQSLLSVDDSSFNFAYTVNLFEFTFPQQLCLKNSLPSLSFAYFQALQWQAYLIKNLHS